MEVNDAENLTVHEGINDAGRNGKGGRRGRTRLRGTKVNIFFCFGKNDPAEYAPFLVIFRLASEIWLSVDITICKYNLCIEFLAD